jgi:GT2 family glycosyltransferase
MDELRQSNVTLFAMPKPFRGHNGVIQKNALASWTRLDIVSEIILLGDEEGTAEAARSAGATHCKDVRFDRVGTPLLDHMFHLARERAKTEWLFYVNADIILLPRFGELVKRSVAAVGKCLIVSQRWNMDITESFEFSPGWPERLTALANKEAELFSPFGIDVFVFHTSLFADVPPFALGRSYWDNWLVSDARRRGYPVVDVTDEFNVIHQNHSYDGYDSMSEIRRSQQGLRNFWLAGDSGFGHSSVRDATHCLRDGEIVPRGVRKVSVVVPHAGTLSQLRKCLRALAHQNYPRSYIEVIVVENYDECASTPALLDFPFIKLTREEKRGPAAARNKGAALAEGDIIAFLDSDCDPNGDWIEKAVAAAEAENNNCVVACNIQPRVPKSGALSVCRYEALMYHAQKHYVQKEQACITGGMIVPVYVWLKVGPFDEDFPEAACEDWEWSTRASSLGFRIIYAEDAVVSHPVHRSWRELREKSHRLARGELRLARKRGNTNLLNFRTALAAYTNRFKHEIRKAASDKSLSLSSRSSVVWAATRVLFWSVSETRRQLRRNGVSENERKVTVQGESLHVAPE